MSSPSSQVIKHELLGEVQGPEAPEPSSVGKTQGSTSSPLVRRSRREKTQLFKPCYIDESEEAMLPRRQCRSAPSPQSKALPLSVSFHGWRFASKDFKLWAKKMSDVHEHTWRKAGIFEAIMASTIKIPKNVHLVLRIAERWCSETNTFLFPWGEATVTLEDVMVLLGFPVLGLPVFATLDSSGRKTEAKLKEECLKIKKDKGFSANQVAWIERFMGSGDELEHVAFLVSWLSYFVFPSRYYHHSEHIFPIAVHLSRGTRVALAPAVLAHLYADLSLLRNHIRDFKESTITLTVDLTALFKLVQIWTWERFRGLQPIPNLMQKGEPRLARWRDLKQNTRNARQIFDYSRMDRFEFRPYTQTVENWEFPRFYPNKAMCILVFPHLDDDFISFARCIKASDLVGIDNVEHYFPNRVASQFGMLQDVPSLVNRNNLSREAAWNDYNQPIDDLTTILHIPSRTATPCVTPMFCEWRRKWFPELKCSSEVFRVVESAPKLQVRNIIGEDTSLVPSGSKVNRKTKDGIKTIASRKRKSQYIKLARDKKHKYMKQARDKTRKNMKRVHEKDENNVGRCQTQLGSDNDKEDDSHTISSEPPGKKSRLEAHNNDQGPCHKLASIRDDGEKTFPPREIEQRNEETDETGIKAGKHMVLSPFNEPNSSDPPVDFAGAMDIVESAPETRQLRDDGLGVQTDETGDRAGIVPSPFDENNSSDAPLGASGGVVDIVVSPLETGQTCDDELDVHESYAEKMTMIDNGSKVTDCLLKEDGIGILAGQKESSDEKLCSSEAEKEYDDESLIQKNLSIEELALNAENNGSSPHQILACGDETSKAYKSKVLSPSGESNIHIAVGEGSQGQDCLLHDNSLGSEESENRNNDFDCDADNGSAKKENKRAKGVGIFNRGAYY